MTVYTVMAWNADDILIEHVKADRAPGKFDQVMSAVHRMRGALGLGASDSRWQAWPGTASVALNGRVRMTEIGVAEAERDLARAEANEQRTRAEAAEAERDGVLALVRVCDSIAARDRRKKEAAEAELANIKLVLREIAQSAITEIGSVGPEDAKDAVARLIKELQALRRQIGGGAS